ncbi:unnamed protein product [marine sediment metagenome]|uniref:Uncharacterized protein n=1 Tax=marine sediment metagenome TaxID=412755 RepID=X0TYJ1_9ZZZZ
MAGNFAIATIEWGASSITLLDLMKDKLGIGDTSRDDELSMYLQIAGEASEKYIDNKIATQEVAEEFSRSFSPVALRFWPVTEVLKVFVDGVDQVDDYELFTDEGLKWVTKDKCSINYPGCFEQMQITYTAGYEPLPTELGYAVVVGGIAYETQQGAVSGEVKKESVVGVGSVEYTTSGEATTGFGVLPPSVTDTLDLYRRAYV